jgi:hypothetical protein
MADPGESNPCETLDNAQCPTESLLQDVETPNQHLESLEQDVAELENALQGKISKPFPSSLGSVDMSCRT